MKTRDLLSFAGLLAGLTLSACTAAATPSALPTSTPDLAAEARAMMDQYNQAILKMDSQAIAAFFLPDGTTYDNGTQLAQGPEAILKFMQYFDGVVRVDSYQATITSAQVDGDTMTISGTFEQQYTMLSNKKTGSASGNFTAEWVRQADGQWLLRKMSTQE